MPFREIELSHLHVEQPNSDRLIVLNIQTHYLQ
jgi:hypothetical protein